MRAFVEVDDGIDDGVRVQKMGERWCKPRSRVEQTRSPFTWVGEDRIEEGEKEAKCDTVRRVRVRKKEKRRARGGHKVVKWYNNQE